MFLDRPYIQPLAFLLRELPRFAAAHNTSINQPSILSFVLVSVPNRFFPLSKRLPLSISMRTGPMNVFSFSY
jgi:hypothetical protein